MPLQATAKSQSAGSRARGGSVGYLVESFAHVQETCSASYPHLKDSALAAGTSIKSQKYRDVHFDLIVSEFVSVLAF